MLANIVSAIGRTPSLERLSHDSAANGTAAIVSAAKGRSCQRGSNTEPNAAPAAITTTTASTMPRIDARKDRVGLSRGPISSKNAGKGQPDINALAHNRGAAVAAASNAAHLSQPPHPKLS